MSVLRSCRCLGLSRAPYYKTPAAQDRDADVVDAINMLLDKHPRWGVWKCCKYLRSRHHWNHKRTFNVIDDFNRELLHVEIDTSITGQRLIRVFERLRLERGLPDILRTDNSPEFLSGEFISWTEQVGMTIQHIQPGKPNQNAVYQTL